MGTITVGRENSTPIELYYEDHGVGPPVVLIHGFPFSGAFWEKQTLALLQNGHRVVTYDRRGFGGSGRPADGYDYDTLASDLNALMTTLNLREAVLAGHSMGTGEIVRYLSAYGSRRVTRAILIAPLQPFLLKTADNPEGIDAVVFSGIAAAIARDRYAYISAFVDDFYNADVELGRRLSPDVVAYSRSVGASASGKATADCVSAWLTDFRADLRSIDIPVLVVSGRRDRILPFEHTGARLAKMFPQFKAVVLDDAPHGLIWTHADDVNRAILTFIDG